MSHSPPGGDERDASDGPHWRRAVAYCYLSTIVVAVGALLGHTVLPGAVPGSAPEDLLARLTGGDGLWYESIAANGYRHGEPLSDTAFFPAFPLCARCLSWATSVEPRMALLLVAHLCLAGAFIVIAAYVASRCEGEPAEVVDYTLLALGLLPPTFFMRMAYAEAMFVLLSAAVLYGIARGWRPILIALIVGLASATRPVGVALVVPFALYAFRRAGVARSLLLLPIACGGLIAFIGFQWMEFGDPLAFAKSQMNCRLTVGEVTSVRDKIIAIATLEPIWATYVPSKPGYWLNYESNPNPLFSLQFANPIYFVGAVVLVVVGWRKRWLNEYELLMAAALLAMCYVLKSHDNAMASFGRFSAAVVPIYPVLGRVLHRSGGPLSAVVLALSSVLLAIYSGLFVACYRLF